MCEGGYEGLGCLDKMISTKGYEPACLSTFISPACSSAIIPEYKAFRSQAAIFFNCPDVLKLNEPVRPAKYHMPRPIGPALPGSALAFDIHSRFIGPLMNGSVWVTGLCVPFLLS